MIEPDVTMNREDAAEFLAALKKLRDGLDNFNCQVVTLNSAGLRLAAFCDETATADTRPTNSKRIVRTPQGQG